MKPQDTMNSQSSSENTTEAPASNLAARDLEFLARCCEHMVPAVLTWPSRLLVRRGAFLRMEQEHLDMVIPANGDRPFHPDPGSLCNVSFHLDGQSCTFLTHEQDSSQSDLPGELILALDLPECLIREFRGSFRVPVVPRARLQVNIHHDSSYSTDAQPIDLSRDGLRLAFLKDRDPELDRDDNLVLLLVQDKLQMELSAKVMRREDHGRWIHYGLSFTPEGRRQADERKLVQLLNNVEMAWIQSRRP